MKSPELPSDEKTRLETLHSLDILDTLHEGRFDRLTRMAQRLFGVPIALVTLVDENRQWFKSCVGMDVTETPREVSFCGHAILGNETFVIPDATKDDRFADNPLVLNAPDIRFYAGCPLKVMNGSKVGTLCIIDTAPRTFTAEDSGLLKDLAAMAEKEMMAIQLATLDELTGISNRRGFMTVANKMLSLCMRKNISASLAFFDLNKFKQINDSFGHAAGDAALIAFAGLLERSFRNSDTVARLGGDEFAVLLSGTSGTDANAAIEKLKALVAADNLQAQRGYDIEFSCGLVDFEPAVHLSIEDLLAQADLMMYEAKAKSRP